MIYSIIGLILFGIGLSYKFSPAAEFDTCAAKSVQTKLGQTRLIKFFEEIWFLGRTSFTLITLLLLTGLNLKKGLIALTIFIIMAAIETGIKKTLDRPRPFNADPEINMLQPREPDDPSFPSGDTLRIWFLVLILSIVLGNNLLFAIIAAIMAGLVSLGRMVFGVHYLTDVLAGAGLGFLGAGMTAWIWHLFQLI